jgi:lysine 2,3-aminomutase
MQRLLTIRVKPYYLFQGDMTRGTDHFRTPLAQGIDIMRSLIGHTSGLAVPTLAVDLPGGGGKIPLLPEYMKSFAERHTATNFCGQEFTYLDPTE